MNLLLFLVCLLTTVGTTSIYDADIEEWKTWKVAHGKTYSSVDEDLFRLQIFNENKAKVVRHNRMATRGEKNYFLKVNHFADLKYDEFLAMKTGLNIVRSQELKDGLTHIMPAHVELPSAVDWRKHGAVTPVKDQGLCGSCWAFAVTGALEGQHFRKTGKLVSLSEQNLVDCSNMFNNSGCGGGNMDNAYRYIKSNGGIDTEKSYPYIGHESTDESVCWYDRSNIGATVTGYVDIEKGNEEALKAAVATVGPVSVAICVCDPNIQFYSHGVYDEPCPCTSPNHAVLVVGYEHSVETSHYVCTFTRRDGFAQKGQICEDFFHRVAHMTFEESKKMCDYCLVWSYSKENIRKFDTWIVKNSWGENWGDKGYIRMPRNLANNNLIPDYASYPVV